MFLVDCCSSLKRGLAGGRAGEPALEAMADCREENGRVVLSPPSENSHVLGDLVSSFLTLKTEGSVCVRASSGREDAGELSERSGQLDQETM